MGSCVFQCEILHQWIAQRQVGSVFVYCDGVGCHVLCLRHGIPVWQRTGQSTTATGRHRRDMTSDVKATLNHMKQQANTHTSGPSSWILTVVDVLSEEVQVVSDLGDDHRFVVDFSLGWLFSRRFCHFRLFIR